MGSRVITGFALLIALSVTGAYGRNTGRRIYYIKDHLGSTRLVIDPSKSGTDRIIETKSYYPFGKEMPGKGGLASGEPTTETFTGKELDTDGADDNLQVKGLQLHYFGARYYDAEVVRWVSRDPIEQFSSPYLYTGNGYNPIDGTDQSGKEFVKGILGNMELMNLAESVLESGNKYAAYLNEIGTNIKMQMMGEGDLLGMATYKHDIYIAMPSNDYFSDRLGEDLALSTAVAWEIGNMYGIIKEQESGVNAERIGVTADYKEAYLSANKHLEDNGSNYRMGYDKTRQMPTCYEMGTETDDIQTF